MMWANIKNNIVANVRLVFNEDILTWDNMTRVIGVEEPKTNTRQHTKLRSVGISSVRTTHKEESSSNSKQIQYGLRD